MSRESFVSLLDFENTAMFPGVVTAVHVLPLPVGPAPSHFRVGKQVRSCCRLPSDLGDPGRRFTLSAEEIALLNPNSHTARCFGTPATPN